jgi:hypothetical protein
VACLTSLELGLIRVIRFASRTCNHGGGPGMIYLNPSGWEIFEGGRGAFVFMCTATEGFWC